MSLEAFFLNSQAIERKRHLLVWATPHNFPVSVKNGQSEYTCLATDCGWVGIGGALGLANSKSGCSKFNSFLAVVVFLGPVTGLGRKDLLRGFLSKCGTAFRSEIDWRWMGGWNEGSFRSVIGGAACKLEQGYDEFFLEITKYIFDLPRIEHSFFLLFFQIRQWLLKITVLANLSLPAEDYLRRTWKVWASE